MENEGGGGGGGGGREEKMKAKAGWPVGKCQRSWRRLAMTKEAERTERGIPEHFKGKRAESRHELQPADSLNR